MSTPAMPEPTPWTDARMTVYVSIYAEFVRIVKTDDCRTLERHLRRIVEARDIPFGMYTELHAAIQAAKEELNK